MQSTRWKQLIVEVALRHGIPSYALEKAWKNQFKVLKDTISKTDRKDIETFKVVYMKGFGKFVPRYSEIGYMERSKKKRDGCKGDHTGLDEVYNEESCNREGGTEKS